MKTLFTSASLLSILLIQTSLSNIRPVRTSFGPHGQQGAPTQEDKRRKNFEKAKDLLVAQRVPFDPEILLTPHWRKTLKPDFDRMNRLLISFFAGRRGYEEDHVGVNFLVSDERRCVGAIQSEQGKLAGTNRCTACSKVCALS